MSTAVVDLRVVCLIMYIFYVLPSRKVFRININGSMIIRDSMSLGDKAMAYKIKGRPSGQPCRIELCENSKAMISKLYNFLTMKMDAIRSTEKAERERENCLENCF